MALRRFYIWHLLFASITMMIVIVPSGVVVWFMEACYLRCEGIGTTSIAAGTAFGALLGYAIYALTFRLILKSWPNLIMLAVGTVIAAVIVTTVFIQAARPELGAGAAITIAAAIVLVPGGYWAALFCRPRGLA